MTFIKEKSVDSILATFNKAVDDLNVLAQKKFLDAAGFSSDAIKLEQKSEAANAEGNRAIQASIKIKSITE